MTVKILVPFGFASNVIMIFAILTGLRLIKVKVKVHRLISLIGFFGMLHTAFGIYITYFK